MCKQMRSPVAGFQGRIQPENHVRALSFEEVLRAMYFFIYLRWGQSDLHLDQEQF